MRAAVYLRQSLDAEGTGLAISRQREDCIKLCKAKGWTPAEYVDNSISATGRKPRPAYRRMLEDIAAGQVGAVVVWDMDRLHRQPLELEHFIVLADKHQLALATVSGDVDLSTDNGRLFARIKGSVARAEVERKSARQRRAGLQRAQAGTPWGAHRPFGFEPDKVTHRKPEAEAIRDMYDDLIAGVSQHEIARRLNAKGITTARGGQWVQATVRALLKNPRNAGLRQYKGEIMGAGTWQPIVAEDVWRVAQSAMQTPGENRGGARKHLLIGVAKCGVCGSGVITAYNQGNRQYVCSSDKHVARQAERVEDYVQGVIIGVLAKQDLTHLLHDTKRPDFAKLKAEADTLRRRLDSLATDFADGSLTASQLRTASERIQQRLRAAEAAMSRRDTASILEPVVNQPDMAAAWAKLDMARKRSIINVLAEVFIMPTTSRRVFDPAGIRIEEKTA